MRVGIGLPSTVPAASGSLILDWARRADGGPFSSLAVLDRVVYDSYDPLAVLAAAAAITTHVRLATNIIIGPLRNTALLAKSAASIHALSGGRLVLGLAVGARQQDYEATGVPYNTRGRRLAEQLDGMRAIWEELAIGPRTQALGAPRLLIGGGSDQAFARIARYADGYMHGGGPPRAFARAADKARAAWSDAGRPGLPELWGQGYFALGDEASAAGADYLRDYYAFTGPFAEKIAAGLLTTREQLLELVHGYEEAGCDELILFPARASMEELNCLIDVIGGA